MASGSRETTVERRINSIWWLLGMLKIILFPFKLIAGYFAFVIIGVLIMIPVGYAIAPFFHFAKNMPAASRETILMAIYLPMALAGVFIIIDFLLPQVLAGGFEPLGRVRDAASKPAIKQPRTS